jgi:hypothetical protein
LSFTFILQKEYPSETEIIINNNKIIFVTTNTNVCNMTKQVHIQKSCEICAIESPTIIYENNAACVAQLQTGYIKTNYTKYISPKLFYSHEL